MINLWTPALWISLILVPLLGTRLISVHDLGFHLKAGHWIAEHHEVPQADTFTYTVGGQPYVDSHWLYQLAIYGLYHWGGYGALTLGHVVLILAGFLLLAYRCRETHAPDWLLAILMTSAVFIMERRFLDRPEVASWLLLGATLWILEGYASGKKRPLWLLPLIQLVWANSEGLFVLGWIVLGAFWVGKTHELKKPDLKLTLFAALSIVADFMNPNFLKGVLYPFSFISKLGGGYVQPNGDGTAVPAGLSGEPLFCWGFQGVYHSFLPLFSSFPLTYDCHLQTK